MNDVAAFIERSAEKLGYNREFFLEKNIPTQASNVVIMPFYGDVKSTFILSCFLANQYKLANPRTYLIVCSWPGFRGMFPYVDEFWSMKDKSSIRSLAQDASNFYNASELGTSVTRNLIQHFDNVLTYDDLQKYYKDGFQDLYKKEFESIRRYLPELPGSNILDGFQNELTNKKGQKVVLFPSKKIRLWQKGECKRIDVHYDFWGHVIEKLLKEDITPVVYQNQFTYDMSTKYSNECLYLVNDNILYVLAAMRQVGCVLDIHSGISRLAIAARCPFVCLDERMRFIKEKDYEIDDLCCEKIPRHYVFSLGGLLVGGSPNDWDASFLDNYINRLNSFLPTLNRDNWMSPTEQNGEVSYDLVRNRVAKRMGVKFISSKSK